MANKKVTLGEATGALKVFAGADVFHLATTSEHGDPVLLAFHPVVIDGAVCFHTAGRGAKRAAVGRPVVATAHRVIARIPSYFVDPHLACPATTYFVSATLHGTLVAVTDIGAKAAVLQGLMERFQPEGGHDLIRRGDTRYSKQVTALMIGSVAASRYSTTEKLGQNRSPAQMARIVEGLWRRGEPGDLDAIEILLRAHPPEARPSLLRGPAGTELVAQPGPDDVAPALELLRGQYWTDGFEDSTLALAHRKASAWVGARDSVTGELVATARAIGDSARSALIMDVAVHPALQCRGLGAAVMNLLLDHPAVRRCRVVTLATRDAQRFYGRLGFAAAERRYTEMVLRRNPAP